MNILKKVSLIVGIGFQTKAFAISTLGCIKGHLTKQLNQVQKVAVFGKDDRMTILEYARHKGISVGEAERKFSATGKLVCPTFSGTAQLTGKTNTITTCAHVLFDQDCRSLQVGKCIFVIQDGKTMVQIPVDASSLKIGKCDKQNPKDDWAVIKLTRDVKGALPYNIPTNSVTSNPGQKLIQVSAFSTNFVRNGKKPKTIVECEVKDVNHFANIPIQSDCDSGSGSSGSAQLVEDQNALTLQSLFCKDTGADAPEYQSDSAFNAGPDVSDSFFEALREANN